MNNNNFGVVIGRATREPKIFDNKDGSKKVMLTIAAQNNYKSRNGQRDAQFVELEAFIPADRQGNLGAYAYIHKGYLVAVDYTVMSSQFEKDGQTHYKQALTIQGVSLLEPKDSKVAQKVTQATQPTPQTQAQNAFDNVPAAPVAQQPAPQPVQQTQAAPTPVTPTQATTPDQAQNLPFG